jgi:palmitoyltransferase ZDHHC3/7/25
LCLGALAFTSSMLVSVLYAVVTGVGTIDRLKRKATDTWHLSTDKPMPLTDIFGIASRATWWLPADPVFDDYDRVMGYATLQRLLRHTNEGQNIKELEV